MSSIAARKEVNAGRCCLHVSSVDFTRGAIRPAVPTSSKIQASVWFWQLTCSGRMCAPPRYQSQQLSSSNTASGTGLVAVVEVLCLGLQYVPRHITLSPIIHTRRPQEILVEAVDAETVQDNELAGSGVTILRGSEVIRYQIFGVTPRYGKRKQMRGLAARA